MTLAHKFVTNIEQTIVNIRVLPSYFGNGMNTSNRRKVPNDNLLFNQAALNSVLKT